QDPNEVPESRNHIEIRDSIIYALEAPIPDSHAGANYESCAINNSHRSDHRAARSREYDIERNAVRQRTRALNTRRFSLNDEDKQRNYMAIPAKIKRRKRERELNDQTCGYVSVNRGTIVSVLELRRTLDIIQQLFTG
ncbi:hypothetical protein HN011_005487, partial [Eciton burchellii]